MRIESYSSGKLHKLLKRKLRETWARTKARFADVRLAVAAMAERIENSVCIRNLMWLLESRGRHDLIAFAYNGAGLE